MTLRADVLIGERSFKASQLGLCLPDRQVELRELLYGLLQCHQRLPVALVHLGLQAIADLSGGHSQERPSSND
jgi:hypothetical protein